MPPASPLTIRVVTAVVVSASIQFQGFPRMISASRTVRAARPLAIALLALTSALPFARQVDDVQAGARLSLGQQLFFDKRLSADGTISCASCHRPELAFTDGLPVSVGVRGQKGTRNAPSIIGASSLRELFWDGRQASLEAQ